MARRSDAPSVRLDAVSAAIIEQLQQDGRRSYAAIGRAVGLSEAAVRQRVQRLHESGIMQIVAVTDPIRLGLGRRAMVCIRVRGDLDPVAEALAETAEVEHVVMTAGTYDLLAEVVCKDDQHLLEVLNKRIRCLPDVLTADTLVYLRMCKQTHGGPAR